MRSAKREMGAAESQMRNSDCGVRNFGAMRQCKMQNAKCKIKKMTTIKKGEPKLSLVD